MVSYSVRQDLHIASADIALRRDAFAPHGVSGGSLLSVLRAQRAAHHPWQVTVQDTQEMAVHAALLDRGERGQVIYFGGNYHAHFSYLHDLADNTIEMAEPESGQPTVTTDMFCSGHAMMFDGSLLVAGGQLPLEDGTVNAHGHGVTEDNPAGNMQGGGERSCYRFGPAPLGWRLVAPLNLDPAGAENSGGRWYPTLITLSNGLVLAVGGHPDVREIWLEDGVQRHSANFPEVYDPSDDSWTLKLHGRTAHNPVPAYDYQRLHALSDGRVFFSSPVRVLNPFYDPDSGTFDDANAVDLPAERTYRDALSMAVYTSVLLPLRHEEDYVNRVLLAGGRGAFVCDMSEDRPQWRETTRRDWTQHPPQLRKFCIGTLLPTGEVFISGGTMSNGARTSQEQCVLEGEIFNPMLDVENVGTDTPVFDAELTTWTTVERATVRRRYHSTALLLPDGTVWTAGSNGTLDYSDEDVADLGVERKAEMRIEIYSPPYMAVVDRPKIVDAPSRVRVGRRFEVEYSASTAIRQVVFIRSGSVTHGFNSDQRLITAAFQNLGQGRLRVTAPPNRDVAPPGLYLLWLLDEDNNPCQRASFIYLS